MVTSRGCAAPRRQRPVLLPLLLLLSLSPVLAIALPAPGWAGGSTTRVEVLLLALDCGLCLEGLERRLRELPGADGVQLDPVRGRLSLRLRSSSAVSDATLRSLMRNAGLVVRSIRRSPVAP